jgi:hypothetical protein
VALLAVRNALERPMPLRQPARRDQRSELRFCPVRRRQPDNLHGMYLVPALVLKGLFRRNKDRRRNFW